MFEAANLSSIREWMFVPSMERQQVLRSIMDIDHGHRIRG